MDDQSSLAPLGLNSGDGPRLDARTRTGILNRLPFYREPALTVTATFLVFVVARYMNWGARRDIFATIRFEFLLGAALLVVCSVLLSAKPIDFAPSKQITISIGVLFLAIVLQLPFAADTVYARFIFQERVIKFAMLTFFMCVLIRSPRTLRWFLLAFLFACLYVTQESVQGLISGGLYWENQGVMRLHGSVRMYAHPNSLAGLGMGAVPFVIFLFPVLRNKIVRLGLIAVFCTSVICVIFSGSRTAYVAFMAFLVYWWAVSPNKAKFLATAAVVSVIAFPFVPEQYKERFRSITGKEAEGHSKESRIEILKDAWVILTENPFGVGVASFPAAREARFGKRQDTHNLYMEVATNLGIQGLLVFFTFLAYLFVAYRQVQSTCARYRQNILRLLWRSGVSPPERRAAKRLIDDLDLLVAVSKAAAGFIFVRLALGVFGMDLYETYWWFGAGLAICMLNMLPVVATNMRRLGQYSSAGDSSV